MSGPLPGYLAPITTPAARAYGLAVRRRNRRYDRREAQRVDRPVISVGNLTAGGAGKSPFVRWVAEALGRDGYRAVVAMRGYGSRPGEAGDEEMEYRERLPDVPVVANPDRVSAVRAFLAEHPDIDCVVLDDGFQHRRIHRDLDIVLIDATRPALDGALLPRGWLREPASGLERADAVVVTRATAIDGALSARIERLHGRQPIAWSRHAWRGLDLHHGDRVERLEVDRLDGRTVATMFGTGHPQAVIEQVEQAGARIGVRVAARDHHRYTSRFLARVRDRLDGADALLVTAKDWVKTRDLIDFGTWPVPVVVPVLELVVFAGEKPLVELLRATVAPGCRDRAQLQTDRDSIANPS